MRDVRFFEATKHGVYVLTCFQSIASSEHKTNRAAAEG